MFESSSGVPPAGSTGQNRQLCRPDTVSKNDSAEANTTPGGLAIGLEAFCSATMS